MGSPAHACRGGVTTCSRREACEYPLSTSTPCLTARSPPRKNLKTNMYIFGLNFGGLRVSRRKPPHIGGVLVGTRLVLYCEASPLYPIMGVGARPPAPPPPDPYPGRTPSDARPGRDHAGGGRETRHHDNYACLAAPCFPAVLSGTSGAQGRPGRRSTVQATAPRAITWNCRLVPPELRWSPGGV